MKPGTAASSAPAIPPAIVKNAMFRHKSGFDVSRPK